MSSQVHWSQIPNNTNAVWYKDPGLRINVFHGLGLCLVIATNGFGASLMGGFQAIPAWIKFFNAPKGTTLGLYSAAYFLPSVVTSYIGDYISSRFGRRWAVFVGMGLMLIGGLLNALAVNIAMWLCGRVVIGSGVGIVKVGAPVLIQEIAHPRLRPILGSCYQAFAYIGTLVAAWMCFAGLYVPGDWSWRFPSVLQIIGPIVVIAVTWHCPESPRVRRRSDQPLNGTSGLTEQWLARQGRQAEAQAVLVRYHANGNADDALVHFEMGQINAALEKDSISKQTKYLDFVRTSGNRLRLMVLIALAFSLNWMGNGIISYYLAPILRTVGITAPVKITLINAGLATWNFLLAIGAAVKVDKFGRRPLFLTSVVGMCVCYAIIMGLSAGFAATKMAAMGSAVIPFLYIYFGFYSIAFTPLPVAYTVEILPFSIRSKGLALFTSVATLGNAFNQFVNPVALSAIGWKYYAVYLGILAFYFVLIYMVFPETKGLTAEAASQVFDNGRHKSRRPAEAPSTSSPELNSLDLENKSEGAMSERASKV